MHRDDLAGRGQDVVGDLFQVLLLIEYEIVYDDYDSANADRQPQIPGVFTALVTCVIPAVQFWIENQSSIIERLVLISNTTTATGRHTTK
jgi:hypothetical protein